MSQFAVILLAAGRSSRFRDGSYKKPFAPLANKAVWLHSAPERFLGRDDVGADHPGHRARRPAGLHDEILGQHRHLGPGGGRWRRGAERFGPGGAGPG